MKLENPYPELRQQALDLLAIPAEVERVFSSARRLVTDDRNKLQDTTIEMLVQLKYWWSNEILVQEGGGRQTNNTDSKEDIDKCKRSLNRDPGS